MKHTQKFIEQRKFVMVLPLLVMPFLTVMFWALGGGPGATAESHAAELSGLNLELPSAHFEEEQLDKLSLYEKARKDSLKFQEARDSDPYFKLGGLSDDPSPFDEIGKKPDLSNAKRFDGKKNLSFDPNEILVNQKLEELYKELNRKPQSPPKEMSAKSRNSEQDAQLSTDVQQLESMMEMMHNNHGPDPEGERINTMLEKLLDIQHPDRVREKIRHQSSQKRGQVFPVEQPETATNINLIASAKNEETGGNSFYGLSDEGGIQDSIGNAIEAVIHNTQELVAGATVKMRLLNDVYINGQLIPKDEFVFGTAGINGERLTIAINSIRNDNSLFPVSLAAYDLDGLEGIYVPGAITRDAAKQSSDQAMQGMQFMTMDQSLGAQAGAAGIQAAKGLFSKKVKLVKVTVKAGYKILLKDGNNRG